MKGPKTAVRFRGKPQSGLSGGAAMPYNSGAVATYKMLPAATSRYSTTGGGTTSSSYRTAGSDRPYYSSSTGSYSRSTIPRSYSIDTKSTYTSGTSSLQSRTSSLSASRHNSLTTSEDSSSSSRAGSFSREPSTSRALPTSTSTRRQQTSSYSAVDSAADLYSKYSPSNYVPNSSVVAARSVTAPIAEVSVSARVRVRSRPDPEPPRALTTRTRERDAPNNNESALSVNRTPTVSDAAATEDDNGNERRLSVAEIRRRFDPAGDSADVSVSAVTQNGTRFTPSPSVVRKAYTNAPAAEISSSSSSSSSEEDEEEMSSSRKGSEQSTSKATGGGVGSPTQGTRHRTSSSPSPLNRYQQRSSWMSNDDSDTDAVSTAPSSVRVRDRSQSSSAAASLGLVGIRNLGNTCFMNSVVQCLSNTKPLKQYLLDNGHLSDLNTTISEMKGSLIKAFATVIQELWDPSASIVSPNGFKSQIGRFAPRFNNYNQQDAQEFLRYLLEGLHEDVNRVRSKPVRLSESPDNMLSNDQKAAEYWKRYLRFDNSKIVDIFVGQLCSTLRCTVCQHSSLTYDPFWDLSLPLPTRTGTLRLQQCLDHFTKEEVLDGDEKPTCAKCQMRRKCTKSLTIQKFPKILVLHLKRFSPNERYRAKLSVPVTFPLDSLDLSSYAESKDKNCFYRLYGIANHSGTTYSGHYMAYCKHPVSGEWHQYNDTRVSSISTSQLVSSEAYLLFYEQTSS